jgi:hypothetical protein
MSIESSEPSTQPGHEKGHQQSPSFRRWWKSPQATTYVALATALIALAAVIAAWLVPALSHFSGRAQAKTNVCSTYTNVRNALQMGTINPRPGDPVAQTAVAANNRLAMIGGSSYLKETLAAQPAAPADLTKAVNSMANTLNQMGFAYLVRADATVLQPLNETLASEIAQIDKMCPPKK